MPFFSPTTVLIGVKRPRGFIQQILRIHPTHGRSKNSPCGGSLLAILVLATGGCGQASSPLPQIPQKAQLTPPCAPDGWMDKARSPMNGTSRAWRGHDWPGGCSGL